MHSFFLMKRSQSSPSLLKMDAPIFDEDFESQDPSQIEFTDAQILPPGAHGFTYISDSDSDSQTYSDYPEPATLTSPNENAIHMTDLKNIREALATLSGFNGGQIGQFLKEKIGLLIMPLHAVSVLRIPHGNHVGNYPIIIYYPVQDLEKYPHLDTFNDAIKCLYFGE